MKKLLLLAMFLTVLFVVRADDDDDDLDSDDRCFSDYNCDLDECCRPHWRYQSIQVCVDQGEKLGSYCGGPFSCGCSRGMNCIPFNETGYAIFPHPRYAGVCQPPINPPPFPVNPPVAPVVVVKTLRTHNPLPPYIGYRDLDDDDDHLDDFDDLFDDD